MDLSMACLLLADCKSVEIDQQYSNPTINIHCKCKRCRIDPPPSRPDQCRCSGRNCAPEAAGLDDTELEPQENLEVVPKKRARRGEAISKELRAHAVAKLEQLRWGFFDQGDNIKHGFFAPQIYLPDSTIKIIIDKLYSINQVDDLTPFIKSNKLLSNHREDLFAYCQMLREEFAQHHAAKQAAASQAKKDKRVLEDELEDEPGSDNELEGNNSVDHIIVEKESENGQVLQVQEKSGKSISWRINFQ